VSRYSSRAEAERSPGRLGRNKRKKLCKYFRFTHEETALLSPYPEKWWVSLISGAAEAGFSLERFLSHEERIKKVVGIQLSSLNPAVSLDRTRKPGPERIQNIMDGLGYFNERHLISGPFVS
jgi:hypothetical protein